MQMHPLNLEIIRQRAEETNRRAERFGPLLAELRGAAPPHSESPVTVRLATANDGPALVRVADLDSALMPSTPLLVGERGERVVAAVSLRDGAVIADPFAPTADVVALLRLRARQMGHRERPARRLRLSFAGLWPRRAESR
jgi:hypothetical protein